MIFLRRREPTRAISFRPIVSDWANGAKAWPGFWGEPGGFDYRLSGGIQETATKETGNEREPWPRRLWA